jgi:AraC-like DNA-binding protein
MGRVLPHPRLRPYVEHLWWVQWDLTGRPAVPSQVLPAPSVHLTIEDGRPERVRHGHELPAVLLHGVVTRDFTIDLTGAGWVAGARFRPGGWSALAGADASRLTDQVVRAEGMFADLGRSALEQDRLSDRLDVLNAGLGAMAPAPDDDYLRLCRLIDAMRTDSALRVEDLPRLAGWSLRTLQRRFRLHIGASPKWVLQRYRMIDAAYAIENDPQASLAELSIEHGWYDQAHFTNDFRTTVGTTPGAYAERAAESLPSGDAG